MVVGAAVFSLIAGLDPIRTQLAGLFAIGTSLFLADLAVGSFTRVRLAGRLQIPDRVVAGTMVTAVVHIENRSRRTGYDLEATLPRMQPGLGMARESDRCDLLPAGESAQLLIHFLARQRGAYPIGPAYVGTTYPLGIVRKGNQVGQSQTLLVTPRIHPMRSLRLHPGLRYQPGGVPLASETGESLEFVGVRDYRPGDSLRKVHWKLWARKSWGPPVVREFSQEYYSRIGLILDSYRPDSPEQFEAAVETIASVAHFLSRQDAIVDFFAAGRDLHLLTVGRHLGGLERVMELLAYVQPLPKSQEPYEELAPRLQELLPRLSAVLIVTFAMDAARKAFLERLRAAGVPLRILVMGAAGEAHEDVSYLNPETLMQEIEQL